MPRSKPGTLTPNVVTKVTIVDTWPHGITIINLSGSAAGLLWYRLDGVDPVPMGEDTFVCVDAVFVPHPATGQDYSPSPGKEPIEVRLISSAALAHTVEGNLRWAAV